MYLPVCTSGEDQSCTCSHQEPSPCNLCLNCTTKASTGYHLSIKSSFGINHKHCNPTGHPPPSSQAINHLHSGLQTASDQQYRNSECSKTASKGESTSSWTRARKLSKFRSKVPTWHLPPSPYQSTLCDLMNAGRRLDVFHLKMICDRSLSFQYGVHIRSHISNPRILMHPSR